MRTLLMAVVLVSGLAVCAYAQDAAAVATQVTTELQNAGVLTAQEASSVKASVKTLVEAGVTAKEVKTIVANAAKQAKAQGTWSISPVRSKKNSMIQGCGTAMSLFLLWVRPRQ